MAYCADAGEQPLQDELPAGSAWRITNAEEVEIAWRVRSLQFFSDYSCTDPLMAIPNSTGVPLGTNASDMTDAQYVFALRSPRGWETLHHCTVGECHVGFAWYNTTKDVRCLLLSQGETGLHAGSVTLQTRKAGIWEDVVTWHSLEGGRVKLALSCPPAPSVKDGEVSDCKHEGDRSQKCSVHCKEGFGTVEPRLQCLHGAWYVPECLPVGTLVRLVAVEPQLIKPFWVVLDAALYANSDCTDVHRMHGVAISSGEYVIKYANYQPGNAWDGDASTSWASAEPCTPRSCYIGFRFQKPLDAPIRCARIEHAGRQYHATAISVETLGASGWEVVPDVTVRLLPEDRSQEL